MSSTLSMEEAEFPSAIKLIIYFNSVFKLLTQLFKISEK